MNWEEFVLQVIDAAVNRMSARYEVDMWLRMSLGMHGKVVFIRYAQARGL